MSITHADLERGDSEGDTSGSEDGDDEPLDKEDGVMPEALKDDMRCGQQNPAMECMVQ